MHPNDEAEEADDSDLDALAAEIRRNLEENGLAHLDRPLPLSWFEPLSRRLGPIELRTDIRVDERQNQAMQGTRTQLGAGGRPSIYRPEALEYHTDRPTSGILAWYCVEQDETGGDTALIDTRDLPRHLGAEDLEILAGVQVWYTVREPGGDREQSFQAPVLSRRGGLLQIYYAPWMVADDGAPRARRALDRLDAYIAGKHECEVIRIRLLPGQCLYIDNRRLLHGRGAIAPHSRRHLIRLYIRGEASSAEGPAV